MHLIATEAYLQDLYSESLAELVLDEIDQDLNIAELASSNYTGCCILCAWNISGMSGIEFAIEGWRTARASPPRPTIEWEDDLNTQVSGTPFWPGALAYWGMSGNGCDQTDTHARLRPCEMGQCTIYPFAHFRFDLRAHTAILPVTLDFADSPYTYPSDPHICVLDCSQDLVEDSVPLIRTSCCILGSTLDAAEPCTWSAVKALYREGP